MIAGTEERHLDGVACRLAGSRSASSAKSIIMTFFFTMPIKRMMPISAITLSSVTDGSARIARRRPTAASRGSPGWT
jgi:hypothetical protein